MDADNLLEDSDETFPFNSFYGIQKENFIDKSLFIKAIFNSKFKNILICVPEDSGKTMNIDMLETFSTINTDDDGQLIPLEETLNYLIFKNYNCLIYQDQDFLQKYCAKYPVIHLSFGNITGVNFYDIIAGCRELLSITFTEHSYLTESNKLSDIEIALLKKYQQFPVYHSLYKEELVTSLKFLSKCLFKHFDERKVILLIDDYDSMIQHSWFERNISVRHVYELLTEFLATSLDNEYVEKAVITGILYFDVFGSIEIGKYLFLQNHEFVEYYGITELESNKIFAQMNLSDNLVMEYKRKLSKYKALNGLELCSVGLFRNAIWSISVGVVLNYYFNNVRMDKAIRIPVIRYGIEKLRSEKSLVIEVKDKLNIDDILKLHEIDMDHFPFSDIYRLEKPDLFISFLLQRGYLTYVKRINDNLFEVKVANTAIIKRFKNDLAEYYKSYYSPYIIPDYECNIQYISEIGLILCAKFFNSISPISEENTYKEILIILNQFLDITYKEFYDGYQTLIFDIMSKTDFHLDRELTFIEGPPNTLFYKDNYALIIQAEYNKCPKIALQKIFDKYLNIFEKKSEFKNSNDKIYIGLNITVQRTANINVLVNSTNLDEAKCF